MKTESRIACFKKKCFLLILARFFESGWGASFAVLSQIWSLGNQIPNTLSNLEVWVVRSLTVQIQKSGRLDPEELTCISYILMYDRVRELA